MKTYLPVVLLFIAAWLILTPHGIGSLGSSSDPATSYGEALERISSMKPSSEADIFPVCRTHLMTHGHTTATAFILVHGYTSCPEAFRELGNLLYRQGNNVLIATLPKHGLKERMTHQHAHLTAEELAEYADDVVDIAAGLGEEIVMAGISAGGVITAWAALNREEIRQAVVISPAFGFKAVPLPLTAAAMNIFSVLPDKMTWWDEELKSEVAPPYAYPQYSRRALTEILRLGFAVNRISREHAPKAQRITVLFNEHDDKISNSMTRKIVNHWKEQKAALDSLVFADSLNLPHDLIDPNLPDARTGLVYPKLLQAVGVTE
jgi:esterase/lipase